MTFPGATCTAGPASVSAALLATEASVAVFVPPLPDRVAVSLTAALVHVLARARVAGAALLNVQVMVWLAR